MTERPFRIAIVDDSEADTATYKRWLGSDGVAYDIVSVVTGDEGLDLCTTFHPDVVLLDYDLPDMNGLEFLDDLGAGHERELTPVVLAITGQPNPRIAADLIRHGALDYLSKSEATEETLRVAVRHALRTRALKRDLAQKQEQQLRSERDLRHAVERASFIASLSDALARSLDLEQTIDTVARFGLPYLADGCFVDLLEGDRLVRRTFALSDQLSSIVLRPLTLQAAEKSAPEGTPRAMASRQSVTYSRSWLRTVAQQDENIAVLLEGQTIAALTVVPLLFDGKAVGAIGFCSRNERDANLTAVAEEVARRASIAIVNARMYELERESKRLAEAARARLNLISRASSVFATTNDWRQTLNALSAVVVPEFCDFAQIIVVDDDGTPRVVATASTDREASAAARRPDSPLLLRGPISGIEHVIATATSEFVPDADHFPDYAIPHATSFVNLAAASQLTSYICVPIVGSDKALGVIVCIDVRERQFTLDDLAVAEDVGRRAGTYLENARLFDRSRETARLLQASLLPHELPVVPNVALSARCLAGVQGIEVGGDWYDAVELPNGHIAFAIGDVSGRGIRAAVTMGQIRSSLRAYVLESFRPRDTLRRLNAFMLRQHSGNESEFATLIVGTFDPATGVVNIASAGHFSPLLRRADGTVAYLELPSALPIGMFSNVDYEEMQVTLEPGTTLFAYTDGLIETRERGVIDGLHLLETAASEIDVPFDEFVDAVFDRVLGEAGDDATAFALGYRILEEVTAGTRAPLALAYSASPESAGSIRRGLGRYLEAIGIGATRSFDIITAVGEAVANVIEHAYPPGISGPLFTEAHVRDGRVIVDVRDNGRWKSTPRSLGQSFDEHGRGITLMRALVEDVRVDRTLGGTRVRLFAALASSDEIQSSMTG